MYTSTNRSSKDPYDRNLELSRTDLVLTGIALGFSGCALATGLGYAQSTGNTVLYGLVTLALFAGAVASLWGALQWGTAVPQRQAPLEREGLSGLERAHEISVYNVRSRTA